MTSTRVVGGHSSIATWCRKLTFKFNFFENRNLRFLHFKLEHKIFLSISFSCHGLLYNTKVFTHTDYGFQRKGETHSKFAKCAYSAVSQSLFVCSLCLWYRLKAMSLLLLDSKENAA